MVQQGPAAGARIDPQPFEMALMQARARAMRDEAQLEAARVTLARYRTLLEQDSIARQDVDTQAALVKQLEGTVIIDRAAEARPPQPRLHPDHRAGGRPHRAAHGRRRATTSAANDSTGIAVITQMNPIDVAVRGAAGPRARHPGAPRPRRAAAGRGRCDRVRSALLDTGIFSTLDNLVDTSTGTVQGQGALRQRRRPLFPNQFVNVQLLLRTIVDALVVPVTALRNGPNGTSSTCVNEDTHGLAAQRQARRRHVSTWWRSPTA